MFFKMKPFVFFILLFFSANVLFAYSNEELYDQVPSKMLEVTKLKKLDNQNQNVLVIKYDCMCGVKAIEIIKKLKQIRVYSACAPFKETDHHEKYRITDISKNGSTITFKVKRVDSNLKKTFSFKKISDGVYQSNISSERGGLGSSEEIITKHAIFVDASRKAKYPEVEEDCGNFGG